MSAANDGCQTCACPDPVISQIPGVEGEQGAAGSNGSNGVNAYTVTTASFLVPATGNSVSMSVGSSAWLVVGQIYFVEGAGFFRVVSKSSSVEVTGLYLAGYPANTHAGATINAGAGVSPAGEKPALAASLPTAFTDNSGGTQSNTIAAGVGVYELTFPIDAATIANGDLLTNYVPGHAFKILKVDAICNKAVTTGAKAATINMEINTTNLTGGVVSLSGTYSLGGQINGSVVSANNTGTASDSFSIEASGVTTFVEGSFVFVVSIANQDTVNALASLAKHTNDLITSLS